MTNVEQLIKRNQLIRNIEIDETQLKLGMIVYGTTYTENSKKTGFAGILKPTKGVICHTNHKATYERDMQNGINKNRYARQNFFFIPLKKNAKSNQDFAWSKARSTYGVFFTKTEEDSWTILSLLMKNTMNRHTSRMQELYDLQKEIMESCNLTDPDIFPIIQRMKNEAENYRQITSQTDNLFDQYIKDYMAKKGIIS